MEPTNKPVVAAKPVEYVSVDKSFRGYQHASGILRPNVFGIYTAATKDEADLIAALVKAGSFVKVEPAKQED
jgi:hypothetical protein